VNGIVRKIVGKYYPCVLFSFLLFIIVWLSEILRDIMLAMSSGWSSGIPILMAYSAFVFFLFVFGIIPLILLGLGEKMRKALLGAFNIDEELLEKKEKPDEPQPKETKNSKASNEQIEDEIFDLVQFVDRHKRDLFTTLDKFDVWSAFLVLFVFAFVFSMAGVMIMYGSTPESILSALSLGVASTALGIAAFSHLTPIFERNEVRKNYERIVGFAEKEKPNHQRLENNKRFLFLKALIKIKAKNPKFDLEKIYEFNKDMFTPEKLMERLCE